MRRTEPFAKLTLFAESVPIDVPGAMRPEAVTPLAIVPVPPSVAAEATVTPLVASAPSTSRRPFETVVVPA